MIKEKELQEYRPQMRISDGKNITLQEIQMALQGSARQKEIPISFRVDQVKAGGLIGGKTDDCLVLYHPEHEKDYFNFCIRTKYQGNYAFVFIDMMGTSKLIKAEMFRKKINMAAKEGINYRGYNPLNSAAAGAAIVGAGVAGVKHLIKGKSDKEKREIEEMWYLIMGDIFDEVFN